MLCAMEGHGGLASAMIVYLFVISTGTPPRGACCIVIVVLVLCMRLPCPCHVHVVQFLPERYLLLQTPPRCGSLHSALPLALGPSASLVSSALARSSVARLSRPVSRVRFRPQASETGRAWALSFPVPSVIRQAGRSRYVHTRSTAGAVVVS